MYTSCRSPWLGLFLIFGILIASPVLAVAQDSPAELLPETTLLYAEISDPPAILAGVMGHSLVKSLQEEDLYQAMLKMPQATQFFQVLKHVESQLGMEWDEAFNKLTSGGITVAFDAKTEGAALFIKAKDKQSLDKIVLTVLNLARNDAKDNSREDPYEMDEYRGITTYGVKNGGFAVYENWFVFVTNEHLGQVLLDRLLDGTTSDALASNKQFKQAVSQKKKTEAAWAYADLKSLRDVGVVKEVFSGEVENPLVEILIGGILEVLKETPYITASISGTDNAARLRLSVPFQSGWIPEEREHYFGPRAAGQANEIPEVPHQIFGLSAYRDFSEMWLRAGDLFNERINDQMAQADSTLTTFFSGKDFGEDILGAMTPQFSLVVTRQEFPEDLPVPALKLPSFAITVGMDDPKTTSREFKRVFLSMIGFFNVVGVQNGQPQLELDFEKHDHGELVFARFVPEVGTEKSKSAKINFNFSPTVAFSGDQFIVASTVELARNLAALKKPVASDKAKSVNTSAILSASALQAVLEDNLTHLVSQNMLEKGHTKEEAENETGMLLKILGYFQNLSLSLSTTNELLNFELAIEIAE